MKTIITLFIIGVSTLALTASKPFRGHLYDHKGNPIKNVKVYVHHSNEYVKSDKNGKFILENVDPADTVYIKWRGHVYDIPVDSNAGISVKFGREPMSGSKGEYVDLGLFGTMRAGNYNGRLQRNISATTAHDILSMQSWKEGEPDPIEIESRSHPFRGYLYDYKGNPIKNAKVYVDDPQKHVKTDKSGKFLIYGVFPTDTIYVKWKGKIYDIPVDGNKGISVKFGKDYPKRTDDYVDTGKGIIDVRTYNGPRSVMNAKQLEATGQTDLALAMRRMPGVTCYWSDKTQKYEVSIRHSDFKPLWIVDGVEMTELPDITVMEVERVEVLKDGAGYGSRAAGGVIIVTLKGGPS